MARLSIPRFWLTLVQYLGASLCVGVGSAQAQALPAGCDSLFPYTCLTVPALQTLDGPWVHSSGREERIPFRLEGPSVATFTYTLPAVDSLLDDSLYLCFSGIGAEGELVLDDRYLGIHRRPFSPWRVALARDWLCAADRRLTLTLRQGPGDSLLPHQFAGLFRPVYLMTQAQYARLLDTPLPQVAEADTVALVAPYFRRAGYSFEVYEAVFMLLPLRERGVRDLHFAFAPSVAFRALCAQMGFREVKALRPGTWVLPVNAYPYEARHFPYPLPFWLDESGNRTRHYGDGLAWGTSPPTELPAADRQALIFLLMLPLVGALLIRLLSPGFWALQVSRLQRPWQLVDWGSGSSPAASGLWLLLLVKTLAQALTLALLMYYVAQLHQWEVINGFQDWGLLNRFFYPAVGLGGLLLRSVLVFGVWLGLRLIGFQMLETVFRIKGLLSGLLELEVNGAYPLVLGLPLAMGLLLFAGNIWPTVPVILLMTLGGIYWLRRAYVMYQGLGRQFSFSYGMKILYICTFNVMPYIFWL